MDRLRKHKLQIITALIILATVASTGISIYMAQQAFQETYHTEEAGYGDSRNN